MDQPLAADLGVVARTLFNSSKLQKKDSQN